MHFISHIHILIFINHFRFLYRKNAKKFFGGGKLQQTESWWPSCRGYKRLRTEDAELLGFGLRMRRDWAVGNISLIFMIILCNYHACYHSFMNFLHWFAILLKSIFLHYLGLIMCFIDV